MAFDKLKVAAAKKIASQFGLDLDASPAEVLQQVNDVLGVNIKAEPVSLEPDAVVGALSGLGVAAQEAIQRGAGKCFFVRADRDGVPVTAVIVMG